VCRIAKTGKFTNNLFGACLVLDPIYREALAGQIDTSAADAGQALQTALDVSHARSTGDAVDCQVHVNRAVVCRSYEGLPVTLMYRHDASLSRQ